MNKILLVRWLELDGIWRDKLSLFLMLNLSLSHQLSLFHQLSLLLKLFHTHN